MCFREGKVCIDGEECNKCDFPLRHNSIPSLLGLREKANDSNHISLHAGCYTIYTKAYAKGLPPR